MLCSSTKTVDEEKNSRSRRFESYEISHDFPDGKWACFANIQEWEIMAWSRETQRLVEFFVGEFHTQMAIYKHTIDTYNSHITLCNEPAMGDFHGTLAAP